MGIIMTSWLVLPLCLCCCILFSSTTGTATLKKQTSAAYDCPGTEVVFTCVVNTTILSWDIDFLSSSDIDRVAYTSSDPVGQLLSASSRETLSQYDFNLTSKSPLTSTMTTIASTELSGATLSCRDGIATDSFHRDTLTMEIVPEPQMPINVTAVMPLFHPSYDAASSLNVTLEWDVESDPNNPMHLGQNNWISNYTVIVSNSPQASNSRSGHIFYTSNTSIPLALHYDRDYNISVMATNCAGNSTPAEVHIRLVYCGSFVGRDVSSSTRENQVDKFTTYCLHDHSQPELVLFPEEIKPDKSTLITSENNCSKNGSKNGSIHQTEYGIVSESVILIPVLTASHLLLSLCTLIAGLLLGCLSHRCCGPRRRSSQTSDKKFVSSMDEPVYSEIPPKAVPSAYRHVSELVKPVDNVAYGQVITSP